VLLVVFAAGEIVKRSPLEVGLVTFTEKPPHHIQNITKNGIPPVIMDVIKPTHTHKWIPGHVRHHAYIPAHLDHLYIPTLVSKKTLLPTHALLLARTVETVFVHPDIYSPYRHHYGGFGIGVDMGGHGAGHGFHVVFNF
ncbi:hypothetical protein BDFB_001737, partial [Asbolus verrucosus]